MNNLFRLHLYGAHPLIHFCFNIIWTEAFTKICFQFLLSTSKEWTLKYGVRVKNIPSQGARKYLNQDSLVCSPLTQKILSNNFTWDLGLPPFLVFDPIHTFLCVNGYKGHGQNSGWNRCHTHKMRKSTRPKGWNHFGVVVQRAWRNVLRMATRWWMWENPLGMVMCSLGI